MSSDEWQEDGFMTIIWLWNNIYPYISSNLMFLETVTEMWKTVREAYSKEKKISRIYQLHKDIFRVKQTRKLLSEHHASLKGLWEELSVDQQLFVDIDI